MPWSFVQMRRHIQDHRPGSEAVSKAWLYVHLEMDGGKSGEEVLADYDAWIGRTRAFRLRWRFGQFLYGVGRAACRYGWKPW